MKKRIIGYSAAITLAVGCGTPGDDLAGKSSSELEPEGDGGVCMVEECFDITAEKDISFIAVETETCAEALVSLHLMEPDGTAVNITPAPHGQGKSCEGIAPEALKFEGLSLDHYVLCVGYEGSSTVGDITITTKAGQVCEELVHDGECTACTEEDDCKGEDCPDEDEDCPDEDEGDCPDEDDDCPDEDDGDCPDEDEGQGGSDAGEGDGGHGGDCPDPE